MRILFLILIASICYGQNIAVQSGGKILMENGSPLIAYQYRPDLSDSCDYYLFRAGYVQVGDDWYVINEGDSADVRLGYSGCLWATGGGAYAKSGLTVSANGIIEVSGMWYQSSNDKILAGCADASNIFKIGINDDNKPFAYFGTTTVASTTELADGSYHTLKWEWESDSIHIYIDGILNIESSWSGTLPSTDLYYFVQNYNGTPLGYSQGLFWDLKVYDNSKTLIRYYPLQECNGDEIFDIQNNTTLTLSGTVGHRENIVNGGYYALGGFQKYSYHNLFYGFTDTVYSAYSSVRIPAKIDKSTSATGSAIDHPAGNWHNRCETGIIWWNRNNADFYTALLSSYRIVSSKVNDDCSWHPIEFEVNNMNAMRFTKDKTYLKKTDTTFELAIYKNMEAREKIRVQRWSLDSIDTYPTSLRNYSQGIVASNDTVYIGSETSCSLSQNSTVVDGSGVLAMRNDTAIKIYPYSQIYDASPIILSNKAGTKLIVAVEGGTGPLRAYNVVTGALEWNGDQTMVELLRLGLSYYTKDNGEKLIFCTGNYKYLYAVNLETGLLEYTINGKGISGMTAAIDQTNKVGYYQSDTTVIKFRCENGSIIHTATIAGGWVDSSIGNVCMTDDVHGDYVCTAWYKYGTWSCLRVFDTALSEVWADSTTYVFNYKGSIAYNDGYILGGGGDIWSKPTADQFKKVNSYDVTDGNIRWTVDLSGRYGDIAGVDHTIITDGWLYFENASASGYARSRLWELNVVTGAINNIWLMDMDMSSCGVPIVYNGKYYSGTLFDDNRFTIMPVNATTKQDYISAFGDGQMNQCSY